MTSKLGAALICALIISPATARADDVPSAVVKTITADHQLICTAAANPDDDNLKVAAAFLAPDYVDVDVNGTKHKRDEVVALGAQMKLFHASDCEPLIDSQTLNPDGTVTVVNELHLLGTVGSPGDTHEVEITIKEQELWSQLNGTWLETASQELKDVVKMDGKVIQSEGH
ncbi:MAG TPA: hypothetical protein VMD47_08345 [Candidatus Acidoferrales bacterium]|nr:hypothetical protein [Candidatus Acidoferrales bacterium]